MANKSKMSLTKKLRKDPATKTLNWADGVTAGKRKKLMNKGPVDVMGGEMFKSASKKRKK